MHGLHRWKETPTTGAEGSASGPMEKSMDKDPKKYTNNESVPRDNFGASPPPDPNATTQDRSKKFPV